MPHDTDYEPSDGWLLVVLLVGTFAAIATLVLVLTGGAS